MTNVTGFNEASFHRLFDLQSKHSIVNAGANSTYFVVLNHIWNARFSSAADLASSAIAQDPENSENIKLYRAWVEALVQLEDYESLAELGSHLLLLGREGSDYSNSHKADFSGLRGIIHVELDQAPAVRLMARSNTSRLDSVYVLEFQQLAARRGLTEHGWNILQASGNIEDYFVWNTLIQDLTVDGLRNEVHQTLKYVNRAFLGSPVFNLSEYHSAVDSGNWQVATDFAAKLRTQFAAHPDYLFFEAFSAYKALQLDHAINLLSQVEENKLRNDIDLIKLKGECLAARAFRDDNDADAKASIEALGHAAKLMRRHGLEIGQTLSIIRKMEDRVGGHSVPNFSNNQFREVRSWMVMLSPVRSDELVRSSDQAVEELHRPMGREASPGDVVLFVARSAHVSKKMSGSRQEWRVVAMYRVTSRPFFHPIHRWHSTLELIDRPEHPIPIDAQEIKSDMDVRGKRNFLPKGHHARFGVFSLDDSAMDIMIAAVKRRSDGVNHEEERRGVSLSNQKPG